MMFLLVQDIKPKILRSVDLLFSLYSKFLQMVGETLIFTYTYTYVHIYICCKVELTCWEVCDFRKRFIFERVVQLVEVFC